MEALLERAGQSAAEVERQAAQGIEQFFSQQLAEAEASEGFATAAEAAASAAEAGTGSGASGRGSPRGGRDRRSGGRRPGGRERRRSIGRNSVGHRGRIERGLGHGLGRLAAEHDHGCADAEWDAKFGGG